MARNTPIVQQGLLFLTPPCAPVCAIGSPQWFDWLHAATTFRFCSIQRVSKYGPLLAPISLRKESRRGHFWYAYRRVSRQLYKRYVGRSELLTLDKLNQVARMMHFCDDP